MSRLTWNEIRLNAAQFAEEWKDAHYEKGETQSFYNEFFEVFGVQRRKVASFETPVKRLNNQQGYIDLFWPGTLLVEHKSKGKDLTAAKEQALTYFAGIKDDALPRFLLICDFQRFELFDFDEGTEARFPLTELPAYVEAFGFILGKQVRTFRDQDPVNIVASEKMGNLHDALFASGYRGHDLERLLVRLLFCLFADDTGIFEPKDLFADLIRDVTKEDGTDLGHWLTSLFETLNEPEDERQTSLHDSLKAFPYVNGNLFAERLRTPAFNAKMRERLLEACDFNWDAISPAIFGALFQSVMQPDERRKKGAHYTTELNIRKTIEPLFLDDLHAELDRLITRKDNGRANALRQFHEKIAGMRFFDPACGCGNFLIIAYRELRELELKLLKVLYEGGQQVLDMAQLSKLNVDQFYGIELEEFPARIAEVALWMTDHIANNRLSLAFGEVYTRIPLRAAPHILHGDALETDWNTFLPASECDFVFGNPPFIGAKYQSATQREQVRRIAGLGGSGGTLDYVASWFLKAGAYVQEGASGVGRSALGTAHSDIISSPAVNHSGVGALLAAPNPIVSEEGAASSAPTGNRNPTPNPQTTQQNAANYPGVGALLAAPNPIVSEEGAASSAPTRNRNVANNSPTPNAQRPTPAIGFVCTNSLTQGEQVAQLWPLLFDRYGLEIAFAHRTFAWGSDARGMAHVHVVIIGLTRRSDAPKERRLFSYTGRDGAVEETKHAVLSPYLTDASALSDPHIVVRETSQIFNGLPKLVKGIQPTDGGHLIFTEAERAEFLSKEPGATPFLRPYIGAEELINGKIRYILTLQDASPADLRRLPLVMQRLERVKETRAASQKAATRALADTPARFDCGYLPDRPFLAIPEVSSERRDYAPLAYLAPPTVPSNLLRVLPDAELWQFALLTSRMHMSWLREIGGRLESRYRYSIGLVYNNFPLPTLSDKDRTALSTLAQRVLDARALYPTSSLADLYDPLTMPADLRKAHTALDAAVDKLYRPAPFPSDRARVEHLLSLYEAMTAPLLALAGAKKRRRA